MSEQISEFVDGLLDAERPEISPIIRQTLDDQGAEGGALSLESLPAELRLEAWNAVPADQKIAVLVEMRADPRQNLLEQLDDTHLHSLFDGIDADDLMDLADELPEAVLDRVLLEMDQKQRKHFEETQAYSDDQVGRWLNQQVVVVGQNVKIRDAQRLLRREIPDYTDALCMVDRAGRWVGSVPICKLLSTSAHLPVFDIRLDDVECLQGTDDIDDAVAKLERSRLSALPVVNDSGILIGRLDTGAAIDRLNERSEAQMMAAAGLDEDEDLFGPVRKSAQGRALWLGINLLTAFLASWFIGLFEATLQQVVALAVLMPVVASMGGIAGSQTLTLLVRGLALGQVTRNNFRMLLKKEVQVAMLNGVLWALVIGLITWLWFGNPLLGVVISLAIVANIIAAAASGVLIPTLLDKLNIDPALSGSVILTTVTDIVGFVMFLGLGSMLLL